MGHPYMILLVMISQTLVYREIVALFNIPGGPRSPAVVVAQAGPRRCRPAQPQVKWKMMMKTALRGRLRAAARNC